MSLFLLALLLFSFLGETYIGETAGRLEPPLVVEKQLLSGIGKGYIGIVLLGWHAYDICIGFIHGMRPPLSIL